MFASRKSAAVCAALALLVAPGTQRGSATAQGQAPASIEDTEWVGPDTTENWITTYRFEKGGVLAYSYNGRSYRNGTWRQDGNTVYFETNNKYRETRAILKGDRLEGDSWNVTGKKWKTLLSRSPATPSTPALPSIPAAPAPSGPK
jgi:hypothetical protein